MTTVEKPTKETLKNRHNDPNNWKWGFFFTTKMINESFLQKEINIVAGQ
jgi:hypothetical protein